MESILIFNVMILATLRLATPLIFAAMGGLLSERSGVVNVALESFMLIGAFVGAVTAHSIGNAWIGWSFAFIAGILFAALYSWFVIELQADQVVTGMAFNLLAMGMIPFFTKILYNSTGSTPSLPLEGRFSLSL